MFTLWAELTIGHTQNIDNRLQVHISLGFIFQWMVDHAAPHDMPVGEAIDGVTGDFVMSSCPDL